MSLSFRTIKEVVKRREGDQWKCFYFLKLIFFSWVHRLLVSTPWRIFMSLSLLWCSGASIFSFSQRRSWRCSLSRKMRWGPVRKGDASGESVCLQNACVVVASPQQPSNGGLGGGKPTRFMNRHCISPPTGTSRGWGGPEIKSGLCVSH